MIKPSFLSSIANPSNKGQLGNEVERQGKARRTSQLHPGQLFLFKEKKKSCPGWDSNPRHSASLCISPFFSPICVRIREIPLLHYRMCEHYVIIVCLLPVLFKKHYLLLLC